MYDGKTLRGSAVKAKDGIHRFVVQVTVYARGIGKALAQTIYDTGESSERAAPKEMLSKIDFEALLIQGDVLHATRPFFQWCVEQGADVIPDVNRIR